MSLPLCQCGCGKPVSKLTNRFIIHHCWAKGLTKETSESVRKRAETESKTVREKVFKGKFIVPNPKGSKRKDFICKKISKSLTGKHLSLKHIEAIKRTRLLNGSYTGHKMSDKNKEALRLYNKTRKLTDEQKENLRIKNLGKHHTEESKKKSSNSHKIFWEKLSSYQKADIMLGRVRGAINKKTKPEIELEKFINDFCLDNYIYCGSGPNSIVLNDGKNIVPDFINGDRTKVIEMYGDYVHRNHNPQDRINRFKSIGINCIVIWQSELKDSELVKNKLIKFDGSFV